MKVDTLNLKSQSLEQLPGSPEFPNQNLRQIGQGVIYIDEERFHNHYNLSNFVRSLTL